MPGTRRARIFIVSFLSSLVMGAASQHSFAHELDPQDVIRPRRQLGENVALVAPHHERSGFSLRSRSGGSAVAARDWIGKPRFETSERTE